jgi:hypothetical protein
VRVKAYQHNAWFRPWVAVALIVTTIMAVEIGGKEEKKKKKGVGD